MSKTPRLRAGKARAALAALAVVGVAVTATAAAFTDTSETVTNLQTGSVALTATGEAAGVFALSDIDTSNIMPGWSGSQSFTLTNSSTGDILVDLTSGSISNGALSGALQLEVREGNATGPVLYGPASLSSAAFADLAIAEGGSKTLWVELSAPANLADALSGQTGSVTLTFRADQNFS